MRHDIKMTFSPLSLEDLESGIWNADVDSFLQLQNNEFIGETN